MSVRDQVSVMNAIQKLIALGPRLQFPHVSAIKGAPLLYELRPRAGRSRYRPIFAKSNDGYVILAIATDAQLDRRAFRKMANKAIGIKVRLEHSEEPSNGQ